MDLTITVSGTINPQSWATEYGLNLDDRNAIEADISAYLGKVEEITAHLNGFGGFGPNTTVTGFTTHFLDLDHEQVGMQVTGTVDPAVWALEYGQDPADTRAIQDDVRLYFEQSAEMAEHINAHHGFGPMVTVTAVRLTQLIP
jgi:hypothetical protein